MTCPVCKRELAPTLSICYACGAMVKDTVREELESKIERMCSPRTSVRGIEPPAPPVSTNSNEPDGKKAEYFETTELRIKKTSPTLVGFQPRNATVPEWRLQLQNSVRQRQRVGAAAEPDSEKPRDTIATIGATALKPKPATQPDKGNADPRLAQALRRIEESRKKFGAETSGISPASPPRNFPFDVVVRNDEPDPAAPKATVNVPPKPRLVKASEPPRTGYDTNKLPPLETASTPTATIAAPKADRFIESARAKSTESELAPSTLPAPPRVVPSVAGQSVEKPPAAATLTAPSATPLPEEQTTTESPEMEFDDIPPISTRLLAGTFDVLATALATGLLLLPVVYFNAGLFSLSGAVAAIAVFGIVYFIYSAFLVWYYGRTLGMQIFSLEIIDAEANEYPSLHQASVYSAASLFTLFFLGLGFIPVFVNEERRAAHDLIAGTVLVREI